MRRFIMVIPLLVRARLALNKVGKPMRPQRKSLPNDWEASEMSYHSYVVRPLLARMQCPRQSRESKNFLTASLTKR